MWWPSGSTRNGETNAEQRIFECTHCVVRRTAACSERDFTRSSVTPRHRHGEHGGQGTRRRNAGTPERTGARLALPRPSHGRHIVSRLHTASPRLASPARTHARTNETNTISRLDSPPTSDLYISFTVVLSLAVLEAYGRRPG